MTIRNSETLSLEISINKLDLLKEKIIFQWKFWEKKFVVACNQTNRKKTSDPPNAKEQYQSFIRKKNTNSVKQSEIITDQPKSFESLEIVDIKSAITEQSKTSHKLSKTRMQAEKVGSNRSLYRDTKKWKILNEKKCKNNKMSTSF